MALDWLPILPAPLPAPSPVLPAPQPFVSEPCNIQLTAAALLPPPVAIEPAIALGGAVLPLPYGRSSNLRLAAYLLHLLQRGDEYELSFPPGTITAQVVAQSAAAAYVRVTTNLTELPVRCYTHWWVNGHYAGQTTARNRVFRVPTGQQINVVARCTRYRSYPGRERGPEGYSGELTLEWLRSADSGIHDYLCQYKRRID